MKQIKCLMTIMVATTLLFVTSCEQQEVITPEINPAVQTKKSQASQSFPALKYVDYSQITKAHFEAQPNFLTHEEVSNKDITKSAKHGKSAKLALVPLVFNKNKKLCTPDFYNKALVEKKTKDLEVFWTDLKTFETVLNVKNLEAYSETIIDKDGKEVWIFDPYVTEFKTQKAVQKEIADAIDQKKGYKAKKGYHQTKSGYALPSNILWLGDIVAGRKASSNNPWGHTSLVWKLQNDGFVNGNPWDPDTKIMEADKNKGGNETRVLERKYTDQWGASSYRWYMLMYVPSASQQEIIRTKNFARNQIDEPYLLLASKAETYFWYCSKLVWYSYLAGTGIDLDYNGGYFVTPKDIARTAIYTDSASWYWGWRW